MCRDSPAVTTMREPYVKELIERALLRELAARRELRAHVQLAIAPNASRPTIEQAFARMRGQYAPAAFAECGPVAVEAATEISALLHAAYEAMSQTPTADEDGKKELTVLRPEGSDERRRALETLRGAIERRLTAAEAHRQSGRLLDAMSAFESVLLLDRKNERAAQALRELRSLVKPPKGPSTLSRMLSRVLRMASAGAATTVGGS
jgi:hypothetical protein